MKVFAGHRGLDAASYYRVVAPFSVLARSTEHTFDIGTISPNVIGEYDVLWLQQHADPIVELIARDFQKAGGAVVYDVDDWLFGLPASWPCYQEFYDSGTGAPSARLLYHERLLNLADVVTCTTAYLAEKLKNHLGPFKTIRILPNCVLQGDWDTLAPLEAEVKGPVLGWFGTENHWDDWTEIVDAVDEALEMVGGYLALLGAPSLVQMFPDRLAARTLVHHLVEMKGFDEIRRMITAFDVGLAWCTDRFEASKCRSPLKMLQLGAAGVPVVASMTVYGEPWGYIGGTRGVMKSRFGTLVKNPGDLRWALENTLAGKIPGLSRIAVRWQQEVWSAHTYEIQSKRWLEVAEEAAISRPRTEGDLD